MELSITYHWHSPKTTVRNQQSQYQGLALSMTFEQDKKTPESPPWIFKRIVNALFLAIIGLSFQDVTSSTSLCHSSTSCRRATSGRSPYPKARLQTGGAARSVLHG